MARKYFIYNKKNVIMTDKLLTLEEVDSMLRMATQIDSSASIGEVIIEDDSIVGCKPEFDKLRAYPYKTIKMGNKTVATYGAEEGAENGENV